MSLKYNFYGRIYFWRKVCFFIYINIYIYYFKVYLNKSWICKVRGKIKLFMLGIILNGGKL